MKKFFLILSASALLIALSFTSCKSSEDCPAYSKANSEQNIKA